MKFDINDPSDCQSYELSLIYELVDGIFSDKNGTLQKDFMDLGIMVSNSEELNTKIGQNVANFYAKFMIHRMNTKAKRIVYDD